MPFKAGFVKARTIVVVGIATSIEIALEYGLKEASFEPPFELHSQPTTTKEIALEYGLIEASFEPSLELGSAPLNLDIAITFDGVIPPP